jgi:Flp pilus assembly protein TadD
VAGWQWRPSSLAATASQLIADGISAQQGGNLAAAFKDYTAAARLKPADPGAYYDLGTMDQQHGATAAAAAQYQKSLQLDPRFPAALYNMGVLESATDPSSSASYYHRDLQVDPGNAAANFNLGVLLINNGSTSAGYPYLASTPHCCGTCHRE